MYIDIALVETVEENIKGGSKETRPCEISTMQERNDLVDDLVSGLATQIYVYDYYFKTYCRQTSK